jgi:hypothetical protein
MMPKKNKNILSDVNGKQLTDILDDLYSRMLHIEDFMIIQSKLLNTNILKTTAIIELLVSKKIVTEKQIEKKMKSVLDEVKLKSEEWKKRDQESILEKLDSDDMGHA